MDRFLDTPTDLLDKHLDANVMAPLVLARACSAADGRARSRADRERDIGRRVDGPEGAGGRRRVGLGYAISKGALHRVAGVLHAELHRLGRRMRERRAGLRRDRTHRAGHGDLRLRRGGRCATRRDRRRGRVAGRRRPGSRVQRHDVRRPKRCVRPKASCPASHRPEPRFDAGRHHSARHLCISTTLRRYSRIAHPTWSFASDHGYCTTRNARGTRDERPSARHPPGEHPAGRRGRAVATKGAGCRSTRSSRKATRGCSAPGREVRLARRSQVLAVRGVVDPPVDPTHDRALRWRRHRAAIGLSRGLGRVCIELRTRRRLPPVHVGIHLPQYGRVASAAAITPCRSTRGSARVRRRVGQRPRRPPGRAGLPVAVPARSVRDAAWAAAVTERIGLGTSVLVVPQHNPLWLANMLASLDSLSGGRLHRRRRGVVGSRVRRARLRTSPTVVRAPTRSSTSCAPRGATIPATFHGAHYSFDDIRVLPKPAHEIPIWVGGAASRRTGAASRCGDGYQIIGVTPEEAAAGGRPPTARPTRGHVHDLAAHRVGPARHGSRTHPRRVPRVRGGRRPARRRAPWRTTSTTGCARWTSSPSITR